MILNAQGKGMIPQADLLDFAIGGASGFDFQTISKPVDRLMMRAVYFWQAVLRWLRRSGVAEYHDHAAPADCAPGCRA